MADDDEVDEGIAFDPTFAPEGPRRSTYTPPTGATPAQPEEPDVAPLDDDALADALAADLSRISTGVVPTPPYSPPTVEPSAQYPAAPEPGHTPAEPSTAAATTGPQPIPFQDAASAPMPASAPPAWSAPAPWSSFPAPDPSQAVPLPNPTGSPSPHAMPADQFASTPAESTGERSATLDAIEKLQAELELRQREATELRQQPPPAVDSAPWPATVDEGAPFLPPAPAAAPVPPESFINPQGPVAAWPFPNFESESAPAPPQASEASPGQIEQTAHAEPATTEPALAPWEQPLPDWAAPAPDARVFDPAAGQLPPPLVEPTAPAAYVPPAAPTPPLPAWEVPAPGPNWAPGPEYGIDLEPEAPDAAPAPPAFESTPPAFEPAHATATAGAPQPWDREPAIQAGIVPDEADEADEADEPQPTVAETVEPAPALAGPPPLVEPTLHGPPVLPSQAAGRPPLVLSDAFGAPPTSAPADLQPPAPSSASAVGLAPPLGESVPLPEANWAAPTGVPLAPPAGDTLDGPTLDAGTIAAAVAAAVEPGSGGKYSFDELLAQDVPADEEPQLYRDPEPATAAESAPEAIFIEPMPLAAGEPVPTDTGSITVIDQAYEEELPDDVDETDRAEPGLGAVSVDTNGIAIVTGAIHPPSGPISTVRIPEDEVVLSNGEPVRMKAFSLEESGLEATPVDHRVGRAARLFWLWFASNSSILSLALGATVFALGMSLRQSVVSVLAGVALSFIPLGLTTLAGKRSGMPTMVVSRATFGLVGNLIPALLALITRVFWGAVLLWLLASSVAIVLVGAALDGGLGDRQLLLISLAIAFLVALLVAFAGYPLFARIQLILSIVSAVLVVGLIALTWKYVDIAAALTTPDGPWVLTVGGTVLVFSFVGLVWANSGADLARYQRPGTSGAASMLWATVGTTLPTFALIAYGALLAASDKGIATGFIGSPLDTLSLMLPIWYPIPLLAATGLSLLSGVILTLYSGGFALQAAGLQVRRQWSIVIVAVLLAAFALLFTFGVTGGMNELFRDVATTIAVPTAAWAGIFAAETMIRNRRFETQSLLVRGGIYADVRWFNLLALIIISVIGFGLTTASITWLNWQGYGFTLLGVPLDSDLAASDVGVLVALALGLLVTLVVGVPGIRRQEALRPNA